jgi:hypothetical protein
MKSIACTVAAALALQLFGMPHPVGTAEAATGDTLVLSLEEMDDTDRELMLLVGANPRIHIRELHHEQH